MLKFELLGNNGSYCLGSLHGTWEVMQVHDSPKAPYAFHYCRMGIFKNLMHWHEKRQIMELLSHIR